MNITLQKTKVVVFVGKYPIRRKIIRNIPKYSYKYDKDINTLKKNTVSRICQAEFPGDYKRTQKGGKKYKAMAVLITLYGFEV